MNTDSIVELLRLTLKPEELRACHYLESRGQTFCVEFGADNAIEKARLDWKMRRLERQRRLRHGR